MKRFIKIIMALIIISSLVLIMPDKAIADADEAKELGGTTSGSSGDLGWPSIKGKGESFIEKGTKNAPKLDASNLVQDAANILTTIGVVIVLAGILIIGIKYMMASPEEAAKLKTKLVGLAISGIVIIGAFGIWKLAITFFEGMTGQSVIRINEQ